MQEEIKIPSLGESITEVKLIRFIKKEGEKVAEGDEIAEMETAKVNQILSAPKAGFLHWLKKEGEIALPLEKVGVIEEEKSTRAELKEAPKNEKEPQKENVQKKEPLSAARKYMGQKMKEVQRDTVQVTTFNEVDLSFLQTLRKENQENFQKEFQVKLGLMSFFVKAVAEALKKYPLFNAYIEKENMVYRDKVNIGVAVSSEKGLFVPVIKQADTLSCGKIEQQIDQFKKKAEQNTLQLEDLQDSGFTITNGGVFGSLFSTPMLNPGEVGILGMHTIQERVIVLNHQMVIRPMMYLALTYDHSFIEGKEAVQFLKFIKEKIENPLIS